jgi:hypothetical protein
MIDQKIIEDRKKLYGDNITDIAEVWSAWLYNNKAGFTDTITGSDVCELMSLMKQVRVEATMQIIEDGLRAGLDINELDRFHDALEDSQIDRDNYRYIADNWDWYKGI